MFLAKTLRRKETHIKFLVISETLSLGAFVAKLNFLDSLFYTTIFYGYLTSNFLTTLLTSLLKLAKYIPAGRFSTTEFAP